jgi:hypothetical protein
MRIRHGDLERIRAVVRQADADEPLTAREILSLLDEHGEEFDSAHRVATVLGKHAQQGEVEVIQDQPYRYRLRDVSK